MIRQKDIIFIISLVFLFCSSSVDAQKRKSRKGGKGKAVAAASTQTKVGEVFEGTMTYANYNYASEALRKTTKNLAQNGFSVLTMTMSGRKLHTFDESTHLHTIFDEDRNKVYVYSDLTNTGVSYPFDQYVKKHDNNSVKWVHAGKTVYKGDNLSIIRSGQHSDGVEVNYQEYWYSPIFSYPRIMKDVYPVYRCFSGIVKKAVVEIKGTVPIVGVMHTVVSSELVGLKRFRVPDSQFEVPSNVAITSDSPSALKEYGKLVKANYKKLKKAKLLHKDSGQAMLTNIREDWPNVKEWEQQEAHAGSVALYAYGTIGFALIKAAAQTAVVLSHDSSNHRGIGSYTADASGTSDVGDGDTKSHKPMKCGYCHGTGICKYCKGSGQSVKTVFGTNIHKKCEYCHGKRVCHKCHGTTWKDGKVPTGYKGSTAVVNGTCKDCGGSGICPECDGKQYSDKQGSGYHLVAGNRAVCWRCHGTGVCVTCGGKNAANAKRVFTEGRADTLSTLKYKYGIEVDDDGKMIR